MSLANGAWFIAWFHQMQDVVRHVSFQIHGYQYATRCTRTCLVCAFVIFCVSTVKDTLHSSFRNHGWNQRSQQANHPVGVSRFKMFADSWFDDLWSQPEPWWAPCSCLYLMSTPSSPQHKVFNPPKKKSSNFGPVLNWGGETLCRIGFQRQKKLVKCQTTVKGWYVSKASKLHSITMHYICITIFAWTSRICEGFNV